jgi:hypothetical protein
MLTHSLLGGISIATAFVWLPATSPARAQEILKELEQSEHGQTHPEHDHDAAPTKNKTAAKGHRDHSGHNQAKGTSG